MTHIARTTDIATCRGLRRRVFIEEQGVSEADEVDDLDGEAIHLLAAVAGRPVSVASRSTPSCPPGGQRLMSASPSAMAWA